MRCSFLAFCLLLASGGASGKEAADESTLYGRFAISALWLETAGGDPYGQTYGAGLVILEGGVGARLSDHASLAVLLRAGFFHAGVGLELTLQPSGDRSADGWTFRVAPVAFVDAVSCRSWDRLDCATAIFAIVELGPQYRWAHRWGGNTLGASLNVGAARLGGPRGTSVSLAAGLTGVRYQLEF